MSINPATDIVLDVARAADPARYKRAVGRLDAAAGAGFADQLSAAAATPATPLDIRAETVAQHAVHTPAPKATAIANATDKGAAAYRQFEAMALANMLEAAMPGDDGFFGKGVAGSTWKSMMIDQIATEMARQGGIGIAEQLAHSETVGRSKTTS